MFPHVPTTDCGLGTLTMSLGPGSLNSCAGKVTDAFVDTCITLSRRVLSVPSLLNLLLAADEEGSSKNVFNSWTKLQVIVQRSKTSKNVEWCFHSLYLVFNVIR